VYNVRVAVRQLTFVKQQIPKILYVKYIKYVRRDVLSTRATGLL